jgi:hypothetical protein
LIVRRVVKYEKLRAYWRKLLACVLTMRGFAMCFISIAKPSRSPFSSAQALFLKAG